MPIWSWFVIALVVLVAVVAVWLAVASVTGRKRTHHLQERFRGEYDRAIEDAGDQRAGEQELVAREKKRKKLDIVALSPEAHASYTERWRAVQAAFVDDPAGAVGDADRLVTAVMRERGYPTDDFDQRAADVSVDHPDMVEHYRAAHTLHLAQEQSDIGTEAQREAFVHYRALFESLLETRAETTDTPKEARA
jgi:hypothetical protein